MRTTKSPFSSPWRRPVPAALLVLMIGVVSGCSEGDMVDQPSYKPYAASEFFPDGAAARPIVPGTVARGQARTDEHFFAGLRDGLPVTDFPFAVTLADLERGRERYEIYCSVCHGGAGYGDGMIVQRGFTSPPSFHIERLREAPVGHFYGVITNGFGAMFSYNDRIAPADRWRIVAYIRALQLSQNANANVELTVATTQPATQPATR